MIYVGDKKATPYYEDYKPVNVYRNNVKIAGWRVDEKFGTSLEWADTYNDKVVSAVAPGASTQVQTVQGKNLCGYNGSLPYTSSGVTFAYNSGLYTIQGTTTGYPFKAIYTIKANSLADGTYYLSRNIISGSVEPVVRLIDRTVTPAVTKATANGLLIIAGGHNDLLVEIATNINVAYDCVINIQLELGSTATPYVPFVPNSPSPDYPSPIISTGEVSGIDLTVTGNAGQSYQVHRDIILRSLPDGTCDTWDAVTGTVTRQVGLTTISAGSSWDIYGAVPNSIVMCTQCTPTVLSGTTLTIAGGITTDATVLYKLATPTTEQIDPEVLPTYPRYTMLSCNAEVTASVRVIEHGL